MQTGQVSLVDALEEFHWPAKAAAELARGAHIVPYEKRSTIFNAGETADLVYILLSGEVKLQFDGDDDASLLVSIARGGQMLGVFAPDSGSPLRAKPEQPFTARALSRCRVAIIPTARVAQALHRLPAERLVQVLERSREEWTHLCYRLLGFLTMGVRRRLTRAIGEIADNFGVADARGRLIPLRLSHDDLAALVGASRPMVSKHLKELASEGVLVKQQGRYVVLPQDASRIGEGGDGEPPTMANGARARDAVAGLGRPRARGGTRTVSETGSGGAPSASTRRKGARAIDLI